MTRTIRHRWFFSSFLFIFHSELLFFLGVAMCALAAMLLLIIIVAVLTRRQRQAMKQVCDNRMPGKENLGF